MGISFMGQTSAHFPQLMQGVGSWAFVSFAVRNKKPEEVFVTKEFAPVSAAPVIGPPNVFYRLFLYAAARFRQSGKGGAQGAKQVFRRVYARSRNGNDPFNQWFALFHCFAYRDNGCNVLHDHARVCGKFAKGHLSARAAIDQVLFRTHGVLLFQRNDGKFRFFERRNAIGLVLFDADDRVADAERRFYVLYAAHDLIAVFQHFPVVARQIRFAFRAVHDQRIYRGGGFQLHVGGEARSAHAYDPRFLHARKNFFRGRICKGGHKVRFVLFGRFDHNANGFCAPPVRSLFYRFHRSGYACVNVRAYVSVRFRNQLPAFYRLSRFRNRKGGLSDMLRKGNYDFGNARKTLDRRLGGKRFLVVQMDSAREEFAFHCFQFRSSIP